MNIAKDYLSQTYTAQGKIMCYNLMIESMQKDISLFSNDNVIIQRLKDELSEYEAQKRYWINKKAEIKQFLLNLNIRENIKQVLILRFVELKKRREISSILHYSLSYIDRLLKRGLFFIDKKLKSSSQKVVI